jgi:hypothetical protein
MPISFAPLAADHSSEDLGSDILGGRNRRAAASNVDSALRSAG